MGDAPETILHSVVDMSPLNRNRWRATRGIEILRAEEDWEGADLPILPSLRGELAEAANELRDPFIYKDEEDQLYLLYVGRGEKAIGIARLRL